MPPRSPRFARLARRPVVEGCGVSLARLASLGSLVVRWSTGMSRSTNCSCSNLSTFPILSVVKMFLPKGSEDAYLDRLTYVLTFLMPSSFTYWPRVGPPADTGKIRFEHPLLQKRKIRKFCTKKVSPLISRVSVVAPILSWLFLAFSP